MPEKPMNSIGATAGMTPCFAAAKRQFLSMLR
jgi:hypothetical protein